MSQIGGRPRAMPSSAAGTAASVSPRPGTLRGGDGRVVQPRHSDAIAHVGLVLRGDGKAKRGGEEGDNIGADERTDKPRIPSIGSVAEHDISPGAPAVRAACPITPYPRGLRVTSQLRDPCECRGVASPARGSNAKPRRKNAVSGALVFTVDAICQCHE
jgi:hypothetical protein